MNSCQNDVISSCGHSYSRKVVSWNDKLFFDDWNLRVLSIHTCGIRPQKDIHIFTTLSKESGGAEAFSSVECVYLFKRNISAFIDSFTQGGGKKETIKKISFHI